MDSVSHHSLPEIETFWYKFQFAYLSLRGIQKWINVLRNSFILGRLWHSINLKSPGQVFLCLFFIYLFIFDGPLGTQEVDSMILVVPFYLRIFHGSVILWSRECKMKNLAYGRVGTWYKNRYYFAAVHGLLDWTGCWGWGVGTTWSSARVNYATI